MTPSRTPPRFVDNPHGYWQGDTELPSVTHIIKSVLATSYPGATEWHMERGHVVHQCCAMLCQGIRFSHDPQIAGQVTACREWLAMRNPAPLFVERLVWSDGPIPFAGTMDLLCIMREQLWIVDWKSTSAPWDQWQLGGYADALRAEGFAPDSGVIVELGSNGKPREAMIVNLRRARNEWRSILGVYAGRDPSGQCARNVEIMIRREGLVK